MDDAGGHLQVVEGGQLALGRDQGVEQALERQLRGCRSGSAASGCPASGRGCRAGRRRCSALHQGVNAEAQVQVQHQRAVFDQQIVVAGARGRRHRRRPGRRERGAGRRRRNRCRACRAGSPDRPERSVATTRVLSVFQARRLGGGQAAEADTVAGRSWPIFQSSACTMVAGQTKPPRLGPSGPRMTGMSPVKSIVPMA